MLSKNFRLFLLLSSFFALGSFTYSFLLIFSKEFGFEVLFIPALYLVFTAITSATAFPFGKLSDKIGRKPVLVLSYMFWIFTCLSLIFSTNYLLIMLAFVLYGLHRGALEPVQKTFVAELAPKGYRASAIGLFQMVVGIIALPAGIIAGMLWVNIGSAAPFYLSLILTIISLSMMILIKEEK